MDQYDQFFYAACDFYFKFHRYVVISLILAQWHDVKWHDVILFETKIFQQTAAEHFVICTNIVYRSTYSSWAFHQSEYV